MTGTSFCVEELGENMWLFASDWPHGDTAWPESVEQTLERARLSENASARFSMRMHYVSGHDCAASLSQ
jgi:hypothetical protein